MLVNKSNYKYGLVFTQILLLISLIIIAQTWIATGDWIRKAVDLSGGTQITFKFTGVYDNVFEEKIVKAYSIHPVVSRSPGNDRISITGEQTLNSTDLLGFFEINGVHIDGKPSIQTIGPALGSAFWKQAQLAIILGLILMGISIYLIYRSPVPSFAIILSAISNMVETVAVMDLLGMRLSLAGIAALLMIIGYSVDTNVVLTTRVLKKEFSFEDFDKTIRSSMVTGFTMSATSIAALLSMIVFSPPSVITEIASVLIVGLVSDLPNTWLQNSAILRWHLHA